MRQKGAVVLRLWKGFFNFYGAAMLLFLVVPVLVIVPLSFNAGSFLSYPLTGFSLRWYQEFFSSSAWLDALGNSLMIAPLSTLLATVLGVLASIGLVRGEFRGKALVMAVLISPMIAPVVIVAVGMFFFFAKLSLLNSYLGLVLAHAMLGVPFVVITVTAVLKNYDHNLTRAAASPGAPPLYAFRKVTLPLQMFAGIRENLDPTIAAAASMMVGVALVLLIVMEVLRRRAEKLRGGR